MLLRWTTRQARHAPSAVRVPSTQHMETTANASPPSAAPEPAPPAPCCRPYCCQRRCCCWCWRRWSSQLWAAGSPAAQQTPRTALAAGWTGARRAPARGTAPPAARSSRWTAQAKEVCKQRPELGGLRPADSSAEGGHPRNSLERGGTNPPLPPAPADSAPTCVRRASCSTRAAVPVWCRRSRSKGSSAKPSSSLPPPRSGPAAALLPGLPVRNGTAATSTSASPCCCSRSSTSDALVRQLAGMVTLAKPPGSSTASKSGSSGRAAPPPLCLGSSCWCAAASRLVLMACLTCGFRRSGERHRARAPAWRLGWPHASCPVAVCDA